MTEDNKKVVIIGGGIVGISTAFYLNKANANLNITIIDSTGPYAGASGKAGGFIASDWTGPDINGNHLFFLFISLRLSQMFVF